MPLSGVCRLSVPGLSVCVPWARCTRAVAPSLLWEELYCHPGGRAWMWHSHAYLQCCYLGAVAPRFLATFHRSCVVAGRPWFYPVLLGLTYHCLRTGNWPLGHASLFVLLPSAVFPWDVTVDGSCVSLHLGMLSVLFPGNNGFHFFGISRAFLGYIWFFLFLSS